MVRAADLASTSWAAGWRRPAPPAAAPRLLGRGSAGGVEGGGHGQAGGGQLGRVGLGQGAGDLAGDRVLARGDDGQGGRPALLAAAEAGREQEGGVDLAPVDQGPASPGSTRRTVTRSRRPSLASTPSVNPAATGPGRRRPRRRWPGRRSRPEGQPDDGGEHERGDEGDHQGRAVAQPLAQVLAGDQQRGPQHGGQSRRPCRSGGGTRPPGRARPARRW